MNVKITKRNVAAPKDATSLYTTMTHVRRTRSTNLRFGKIFILSDFDTDG